MKRTTIGMVSVAVLAALSGCSGQDGEFYSEEQELGTAEQAITANWAARTDMNDGANPKVFASRYGAASCVINDSGVDKLLVIGGYNGAGQAVSDVYLYNPGAANGSEWTKVANLLDERAEAQAIQLPGASNKCLVTGGIKDDETDELKTTEIFTLGGSWVASDDMNSERVRFQLQRCGTSKLIAVGGRDVNDTATNTIDVFDGTNWTALTTLNTARYSHALAPLDTGFDQFVIAGGTTGAANLTSIEFLDVDADCANPTRVVADETLNSALAELQAMPVDNNTGFLIVGGTTSVPNVNPSNQFASTWGTGAVTTTTKINNITFANGNCDEAAGPGMNVGRSSFMLEPLDTTLDDFIVVGGRGFDVVGGVNQDIAVATSQVWDDSDSRWESASPTFAGTANGSNALQTNRYYNAGKFLPSANEVAIATGLTDDANGGGNVAPTVIDDAERL